MDPIFKTWRAEIEQQQDEARVHLAECQEDLSAAIIADREAKITRADLAAAFGKLGRHQVATALLNRRYAREDELKQAEARMVAAGSALKNAKYQLADLEQALRQLDEIAPAEQPEHAEAA
jgi:hypothetical protein